MRVCSDLAIGVDRSRLAQAVLRANLMLAPRSPAHVAAPYSKQRVDDFWIGYHRELLAGCALADGGAEFAEPVYRRFSELLGWRIYDDVRPLLAQLRARGLTLGVISNWTGDLEEVLHRIELHAPFDVIIDSARCGHEKPHPEIFAEALRRADVMPGSAVHVGDSIEHDVDGALRSGLRPILLDRSGRYEAFDRAPRVTSLAEISTLI